MFYPKNKNIYFLISLLIDLAFLTKQHLQRIFMELLRFTFHYLFKTICKQCILHTTTHKQLFNNSFTPDITYNENINWLKHKKTIVCLRAARPKICLFWTLNKANCFHCLILIIYAIVNCMSCAPCLTNKTIAVGCDFYKD